jgi:SpoVK/Ycf46/Vps4 family AAA+-type ATPase
MKIWYFILGRFDKEFKFKLPDEQSRFEILKVHTQKWWINNKSPDITDLNNIKIGDSDSCTSISSYSLLKNIAVRTSGFSGADIKALCEGFFNFL